jgi:hypothetical protein
MKAHAYERVYIQQDPPFILLFDNLTLLPHVLAIEAFQNLQQVGAGKGAVKLTALHVDYICIHSIHDGNLIS